MKFTVVRQSIIRAAQVYKVLVILGTILYWIGMPIDDYSLIKEYWSEHWMDYLATWALYYVAYFIVLSIYYWAATLIGVFVYHKLVKRKLR